MKRNRIWHAACSMVGRKEVQFQILGELKMAITKKSLIGNSSSKKSTKKSTTKASGPVAAAKLATAVTHVAAMRTTLRTTKVV